MTHCAIAAADACRAGRFRDNCPCGVEVAAEGKANMEDE